MQYNKRIKRTEQRQLIDELFNLFKQHTRGGIYVLMIDMRCTKYKYIGNMIWYFKRCGIDITRWNFPVLNSTFYDMVVIIGDDMLGDNEKCDDIYDFIGNGIEWIGVRTLEFDHTYFLESVDTCSKHIKSD